LLRKNVWPEKVICQSDRRHISAVNCHENVNRDYTSKNLPNFFNPSQTGTNNADGFLVSADASRRAALRWRESIVAGQNKSKKLTLIQESARGAQRGLLVILASALLWLLAVWAGYHYLG
jgi:hypothetical protein